MRMTPAIRNAQRLYQKKACDGTGFHWTFTQIDSPDGSTAARAFNIRNRSSYSGEPAIGTRRPPSTVMIEPVIKLARSLTRNATTSPISDG